jgi:hypothetical protein
MNQQHDHKHDHQHDHRPPTRGMSGIHVLKLLALNVVLFGACGAFAGMMMGDWVPEGGQLRFLGAVAFIPLAIAVVATFVHAHAGKWTSADNMSERLFGGKPR